MLFISLFPNFFSCIVRVEFLPFMGEVNLGEKDFCLNRVNVFKLGKKRGNLRLPWWCSG